MIVLRDRFSTTSEHSHVEKISLNPNTNHEGSIPGFGNEAQHLRMKNIIEADSHFVTRAPSLSRNTQVPNSRARRQPLRTFPLPQLLLQNRRAQVSINNNFSSASLTIPVSRNNIT